MNTPGAHQVHHGRNQECIDKNYAGVFIIWDKLYGTYQPRTNVDQISYGLVGGTNSFDFFSIQFKYYKMLIQKVKDKKDYFRNICYGPGWNKSKPELRLGDPKDIPLPPKNLYNPSLSIFSQIYIISQLLMTTAVMAHFIEIQSVYSNIPEGEKYSIETCLPIIVWIYWTSINIGSMLTSETLSKSELIRTWLTAYFCSNTQIPVLSDLFVISIVQSILYSVKTITT